MLLILREGLEALLVVIALLGFIKKSGHEDKKVWIFGGVGIGLGVSIVLAVIIKVLFTSGTFGNNNFLISGWTGAFAAVTLIYVSYWLHSKSSAKEWQNYIGNQSSKALATGSLFSLGFLAFLAVFREGTETVLFYIGIVMALAFTGCSSKGTESENKQVTQEKSISISEASQNMRNILKDMKVKLEAKDEAGAINVSAGLEENWSAVEDNVKNEDKGLYEKVEGPLDTINGGVKIKPLDTKTLTNSMNSLDEILIEVEKLK